MNCGVFCAPYTPLYKLICCWWNRIYITAKSGDHEERIQPRNLEIDGVTLASMGDAKNKISYRGKSFEKFVDWFLGREGL